MLRASSVDINILPQHYRPRVISPAQVLIVLVLAAMLIGLVPAYLTLSWTRAQTVARQAELTRLKALLAQPQDQARLAELKKQIEQTNAKVERLLGESALLSVRQPLRAPGIAATIAALVPRIHLLSIAQDGRTFLVSGQAGSQALVLDYARALQSSGYFTRVRIVSIVNADPLGIAPDVQFTIEMVQ